MERKKNMLIAVLSLALVITLVSNFLPAIMLNRQRDKMAPVLAEFQQAKTPQEKIALVSKVASLSKTSLRDSGQKSEAASVCDEIDEAIVEYMDLLYNTSSYRGVEINRKVIVNIIIELYSIKSDFSCNSV